jgi:hypothetical protein
MTKTKEYHDIEAIAEKRLHLNVIIQGLLIAIVGEDPLTTEENHHQGKTKTEIIQTKEGTIVEDRQVVNITETKDTTGGILLLKALPQNLNRSKNKKLLKPHLNKKMLCCQRQLEVFTCPLTK